MIYEASIWSDNERQINWGEGTRRHFAEKNIADEITVCQIGSNASSRSSMTGSILQP